MCVNCLDISLDEPATAARLLEERHPPEMVRATLREMNAARPRPLPICPKCDALYHHRDSGVLLTDRCNTCEIRAFEDLLLDVAYARSKKGLKRALKRIKRLRRLTK